ncbi:C40 family peptidase [Arthrobacter glacialis]|uniref:C40 family peptidase n=1 Tax=Arthrobacter glacialis TaxID=1664 RepID=UPI001FAEC5B2|nr:C40 family peptidase [Arthrobacter glacialis]
MRMRFLIRGTTALSCAALASTAFIAPSFASPAAISANTISASTAALLGTALQPFSPAIPSPDDIAKAKESEAATATASAKLEAILSSANDRLQASTLVAMGANNTYTDALVILKERTADAETATAKAAEATSAHKNAKAQLAQLAGSLYKSGGLDLGVQTILASSDADDTLYQASTLLALSANRAHTFAAAQAAAATSTALNAQAEAASKAAQDATAAAESSRTQAQGAADAQAAVVAENQSQREVLLQRLATLHNTTSALEGARVDALARKAQEEALKAQIDASTNAPAPERPPAVAPKPSVPNPSVPNPPAPQPPAPNPPVPKPPAPTTPPPVAPPVKPPVVPPVETPKPTPPPSGSYTQVMVNYAMSKVGGPYQWGGNGPTAFDCSGLVQQAFASAGISVPRQGTDQFWAAPQRVPLSQMRYGDLLVFDDDGSGRFGHIAIYIGNNQVVQALNYGQPIQVTPLSWMSGMSLFPYAARY